MALYPAATSVATGISCAVPALTGLRLLLFGSGSGSQEVLPGRLRASVSVSHPESESDEKLVQSMMSSSSSSLTGILWAGVLCSSEFCLRSEGVTWFTTFHMLFFGPVNSYLHCLRLIFVSPYAGEGICAGLTTSLAFVCTAAAAAEVEREVPSGSTPSVAVASLGCTLGAKVAAEVCTLRRFSQRLSVLC